MEETVNQELLFKLSMLEQQMRQLHEQLRAVESAVVEMSSLKIGLDEIAEGKEILSSLGRGIFVKSRVTSENLTVDVGSKNLVKKSIPETKEMIEGQVKKLEDAKKEILNNLDVVEKELEGTMTKSEGLMREEDGL